MLPRSSRFTTLLTPLISVAILCLGPAPAPAGDSDPNQEIVQISTINALIKGIYEGDTTIGHLLELGSFGIGTINHLDGEMLALDGKAYQVTSSGKVNILPADAKTPFAAVTNFHADTTTAGVSVGSMDEMQKLIDAGLPSENLFYAIKITGSFPTMKVRSVPRQEPPYKPLTEVVKTQSIFTLEQTSGTLVGFRCPDFVQGVNVASYHLHYITDDKQQGGHVLGFELKSGTVQVDTLPNFRMLLPEDGVFMKADLSERNEEAIHAVERIRK
jgi:acetolactate decarboxylase